MVSSSLPEACVVINPSFRDGNCASSSPVDLCHFLQMLYRWLLVALVGAIAWDNCFLNT